MPELLTYKEVAAKTGLSERTLRRLKEDGVLSYIKLGHLIRFDPADIAIDLKKRKIKRRVA